METEATGWTPNALFLEQAKRFAEHRLSDAYREDELDYKKGLGALLRVISAKEALNGPDFPGHLTALLDNKLDPDEVNLTTDDRERLRRYPYYPALVNLLGGGQWALIQISSFRIWSTATPPAEVAAVIDDLLRGSDPVASRFDRFLEGLQAAYDALAADGKLRAKASPRVSPQLPAILLSLTQPESYGLARQAVYESSAEAFGYSLRRDGTPGERYAALTKMLADFRDALIAAGCPVDDLLEVHNLLWIRAKVPGWSDMGADRWLPGDFDAMRTDEPQDRAKLGIIESKLRKIGSALKEELGARLGLKFTANILGLYPPGRDSWRWVNVSLSEARFGSQPTQRPQLNVEVAAAGIDVFFLCDLSATAAQAAPVRELIRERRGDQALVGAAIEAGYTETPEDDRGRYLLRRRFDPATVMAWAGLGVDELVHELEPLITVYEQLTSGAAPRTSPATTTSEASVDPAFEAMGEALEDKRQLILYGPPGTGKTWMARRFAVWWLSQRWGNGAADVLTNPGELDRIERELSRAQRERRTWWIVANRAEWSWDKLFVAGHVEYHYGRLQRNYEHVQPGDLVVGYQATPEKRVMALARVTQGLHTTADGQSITLEPVKPVAHGLTYDELIHDPVLAGSEPARFRNQGTLFRLTSTEADVVLARLQDKDPSLVELEEEGAEESVGPLTRVTFHPSYTYEDFVEGYRPVPSTSGQLSLELVDGIFKEVCRAARAEADDRPYLLIIDEINRGNIPKIFGELITVLEADKRGLSVLLPQTREPFTVPSNVFILGTMNTADRSIRLLDAALRRRFAFRELLPTSKPLGDAQLGPLALGPFLDELNRRIVKGEGREKQIGHSFLLDDGRPVGSAKRFAARFTQEILPLLQEYAYDDFRKLSTYLGTDLVDPDSERVVAGELTPDELVAALAIEYGVAASTPDPAEVE